MLRLTCGLRSFFLRLFSLVSSSIIFHGGLLSYALLIAQNPRSWRFINEGYGIAARHKRASRFWAAHLELSKSFIVKCLSELAPESITVMGSGALLDFPLLTELPSSIREIRLIDGNPAYTKLYQSLKLSCARRNIELHWGISDIFAIEDTDLADEVIISLNLISQLALMNPKFNSPAAHHLAQLSATATRAAILIGDQSWLSYKPNETLWDEEIACPDIVRWEIEGMRQTLHDQWLWHVAPYGIERNDYGMIHDVHARLFLRGKTDAEELSRI